MSSNVNERARKTIRMRSRPVEAAGPLRKAIGFRARMVPAEAFGAQMCPQRQVVFASGAAATHSQEAARHGTRHEDLARERVGLACGVHFHPVREVTSVRLDYDFEVRVKPDGTSHRVPQSSKVILEIKCPHSKNMRNQIGARMQLHARQCLLELLAFPEAACLLFAVLNYKPDEEPSAHNYDSVLHRLNRASAMEALAQIRAHGLVRDFAEGIENAAVDDILSRMVSAAVELPKVSRMRTAQAAALLPELFAEIPEHLRQHIAKGFRYDDDVPEDCRRIAALGDQRIDGVPLSEFPRFFLRYSGRVALYHFCLQHLPGEAQAMLGRCCQKASDVRGTDARRRHILGGKSTGMSADAIFDLARSEQNRPRGKVPAPRGNRVAVTIAKRPGRRAQAGRA